MKICFPASRNQWLESSVFHHFGSAPLFPVVETEDDTVAAVINRDRHHRHGACQPLKAPGVQAVDAVAVGGIGTGALSGLAQAELNIMMNQVANPRNIGVIGVIEADAMVAHGLV